MRPPRQPAFLNLHFAPGQCAQVDWGSAGFLPVGSTRRRLSFFVMVLCYSRAYERTSLIVTTNLPFEHWTEVLGSERLTGALLDRLTHRVHILEASGTSYRLQDAKKRLKRS